MYDIIKNIHNSELFGIIVEAGNGAAIANKLYEVEGASNTIYFSEQPYHKKYQTKKNYLLEGKKSISTSFIYQTIKTLHKKHSKEINFILVSSFQISSNLEKITHGYIGYYYNNEIICYHLSIPKLITRKEYLDIITEAGIKILSQEKNIDFVDKIQKIDFNTGYETSLEISLISNFIFSKEDNFLVFTKEGNIRYEDFLRNKKGVILQKGSYNPLHFAHCEILQKVIQSYPEFPAAFLISIENRDKASINVSDVIERVNFILSKNYTVIICKKPMLLDTVLLHRFHWPDKKIILPIGQDTLIRFIDDELTKLKSQEIKKQIEHFTNLYKEYDFKLEVFPREHKLNDFNFKKLFNYLINCPLFTFRTDYTDTGVSSTKIREGQAKNISIQNFTIPTNQVKVLGKKKPESNFTIKNKK